ncbi:MAG: MFS transporter [Kiritimatiellae bacterium]|nr:MFS transporter [Kiritimatiellia bacterium]
MKSEGNEATKAREARRYALARVRQVAAMLFVYATFYVCRLAFSASKKGMIEQGAYTPAEIGYVGSAMLFAYAIGKVVNGFIADRVNVKRYIMLGLFVSSLANLLVGFHVPALMLAVVWFVNGFAQSSGAPCCVVALSRWWPKNKRGTYYGIWSCSNNLGEVLAYVVSAGIVVWVGREFGPGWAWKSCFWGATAFGLVGIAAAFLFFGNAPEDEGLPPVADDGRGKKAGGGGDGEDVARGQRIALTSVAVWLVALAGGFFAASRYAVIDWGMFFLQVKKGYTEGGAATIISVNSVVGAVSSALSGVISDRFFKSSRRELAVAAGALNIAALSLFMLVPGRHVWLDVAAMVMFGFAVGVLLTFVGGLMAVDYVPKCAAGAALGIAGMGNYIGAGLQSILSGYLIERAEDGTATLMGHTFANGYTIDWLAIFWIGVAAVSLVLTVAAGMVRREKA